MKLANIIKPYLPRRRAEYNGVEVRTYRWNLPRVRPDFEAETADAILNAVEPGDSVVIVGGGHGVCSTKAAQAGAHVTVYEASETHVDIIRETITANGVSDRVDVVHGLVGPEVDVWGSARNAQRVRADDLPDCDILVLDCEGAELDILRGLDESPAEEVVIEVHEALGCLEVDVRRRLKALGWEVVQRRGDVPTPILTGRKA